jgi:protein TonB
MEIKKNPKADLNRNSGLYFVIGLTLILFVTWIALEYKSYDTNEEIVQVLNIQEDLKEDVPITEALKTLPPPPPPAAPEVIEIIEDEAEIEETVIESSEMDQETVIEAVLAVDDVEVAEEEEEEITVPFAVIENAPIFPGCESMKTNKDRKTCFQKMMQKHVSKEFKYPPTAIELGIQGKVYVQFVISGKGYITNIRTRGPDANLEEEASRIVATLPQMTPGMQRGRAVKVPYSIPITFRLE